jgi:hypothetical protein
MSTTQLPPGTRGVDDAFGSVLASARADLAGLADTPVWSLDDRRVQDRFSGALALRAQVDELLARLAGQIDERDLARSVGASSTRALLMVKHRMSATEAARIVKTARALAEERCDPTRRACAAGQVSSEQAVVITDAITKLTDAVDPVEVGSAQLTLVEQAQRLTFTQLRCAANHLVELVDPDGADAIVEQQLIDEERRARASAMFVGQFGADGTARGRFAMPNATFAMLKKALDGLASPRRCHLLVDQGIESDLVQLPYASRMGLALCELVEHLPIDKFPQHGVANCSIVVTIDEARLRAGTGGATLDTGGSLSIGEARRLACNAGIVPLVLSGDSTILDLGMGQRLFDRGQRLALAHRDRGCVFPGCERPAAWCEAHHLRAWFQGGPTDLANGCLVCSFHHHLLHGGEWDAVMGPDGIVEVIPPARVDPDRRPIRHERFKPRPG